MLWTLSQEGLLNTVPLVVSERRYGLEYRANIIVEGRLLGHHYRY